MSEFEKIITEYKDKINNSKNSQEILTINSEIFGKNGIINSEFKKLSSIPPEEKKIFAANINKAKQELTEILKIKSTQIQNKDIIERVNKEKIDEVIIATSATVEGQTTAYYIQDSLKNLNVKVTKLAQGLPVGGEIESLDDGTLFSAFKNRSNLVSNSD